MIGRETRMTNDLISRQAAIDLLKQMRKDGDMIPWEGKDVFARIRKLPSAQPDIIYCGECKHMMPNGKCRQFADSTIRPSASDFCSAGERKDNGRINQQTGGD